MRINIEGRELIKSFEGIMDGNPSTLNLDPYLCPAGYWTVGWGHVVRDRSGRMIHGKENAHLARHWTPGGLTVEMCERLLDMDLADFEKDVQRLVTVPVNSNQFSALVSFAYNLGEGALQKSTLLRKLNSGDYTGAADEFLRWVNAGGRKLAGLERRRKAERALFLKPVPEPNTKVIP